MSLDPLAGKPAPKEMLADVGLLRSAYLHLRPNPNNSAQMVAFGTSGHRGSSLDGSFNEVHILAITQAVCDYRAQAGITGPLFIGMDTHALSAPAHQTALEVLAANKVDVRMHTGRQVTPTPLISFSILSYNAANAGQKADGIVITPLA